MDLLLQNCTKNNIVLICGDFNERTGILVAALEIAPDLPGPNSVESIAVENVDAV